LSTSQPIEHEDDLLAHFVAGAKPRERWGVGVEYERIGVFRETGRAVPYAGERSVERLLNVMAGERGWEPHGEDGRVLALARGAAHVTLEPGAQVELSTGVHRSLLTLREEMQGCLADIEEASRPLGIALLGLGLQPLTALGDIEFIPKKRYAIMREYLPRRGSRAHIMMKQTASIQVNLDYGSEADAADKLRTAMGLSPLVTALYANSPIREGTLTGYMSFRAWVWQDTDPDRCGLLPFVFKDGAGFADYLDYALDVPMFFVVRDDVWKPAQGMTFRKFIRKGFDGWRATLDDFVLHLSTLFPEVRLKQYVEVRGADSGDPAAVMALAAFWKGILYDGASRRAAWELVRDMTFKERQRLLEEVSRQGPATRVASAGSRMDGTSTRLFLVRDLLIDLVRLARQGLNNQGASADELAYLDVLDRRLGGEGGCPAARLAADWEGPLRRDPRALVDSLSLPAPEAP